MPYIPLKVKLDLRVQKLYSLHYFQFAHSYIFEGERHDFWEMVYIDHGEADIGAEDTMHRLQQGHVIFHEPGEFHTIWAHHPEGVNMLVISFSATPAAMHRFKGLKLELSTQQRKILRLIIEEGEYCFGHVLDKSDEKELVPVRSAPFGGVQLIANYLEQFLILLSRALIANETRIAGKPEQLTEETNAFNVTNQLSALMREHLDGSLKFEDICRHSGIGQTALKDLFRQHHHMGVMEYYQRLRIEEARRLLRSGMYNVTQIAELLSYSSIHQFSRQFKRLVGIPPSEYLRSIKD